MIGIDSPCQNGGSCIDGLHDFHCECPLCYQPLPGKDESSVYENVKTFLLLSHHDFGEKNLCTEKRNFCGDSGACQNSGICNQQDDCSAFSCTCLPIWTGSLCELDANECQMNSEPCVYGTCENQVGNPVYICHCDPGWTGEHCDIDINECESSPCQNYGTCVDSVAKYTCFCPKSIVGVNCETIPDMCESSPCKNGGACTVR